MDLIAAFVVGILLVVILMFPALDNSYERGQISVASGQATCELKAKEDKTTYWVCEKVKK